MLETNEGQHPKAIALAYRKIGEQISRDEKRSLGLRSNVFFSREALQSLTPAGLLKLQDAHVTTLLRAALSHFRSRMIDDCRRPISISSRFARRSRIVLAAWRWAVK